MLNCGRYPNPIFPTLPPGECINDGQCDDFDEKKPVVNSVLDNQETIPLQKEKEEQL